MYVVSLAMLRLLSVSRSHRDYEIAAEAAEAATTVRLKLGEIIGRVSTDSELVDRLAHRDRDGEGTRARPARRGGVQRPLTRELVHGAVSRAGRWKSRLNEPWDVVMRTVESLPETNSIDMDSIDPADINIVLDEITGRTLDRSR